MPLVRSLRGLDLLNFFVADVQTGFGPFIAVYLTANKWTQLQIGAALSVGTIVSLVGQVPAGALVDWMRNKRLACGAGLVAISFSAVLFALFPGRLPVNFAELLHGFSSCVVSPAIAAVSLQLVGHAALGERLGRNSRFLAVGNGVAAGVMGAVGSWVSPGAVFWLTAALGLPALWGLVMIGPPRTGLSSVHRRGTGIDWRGVRVLLTDRRLLVFAACILLFHLSNAAVLPLAGSQLTMQVGNRADLVIAACIVVPQVVVALGAPWIGRQADVRGRRAMLLLGWSALPARAVAMALLLVLPAIGGPVPLVLLQVFGGVSAAVFGVMFPLIAADLTRGTPRYNLCMGVLGLFIFGGAALSTTFAGWLADRAGDAAALMGLAAAGLLGTLLVWFAMPDTRGRAPIRRRRPRAVSSTP